MLGERRSVRSWVRTSPWIASGRAVESSMCCSPENIGRARRRGRNSSGEREATRAAGRRARRQTHASTAEVSQLRSGEAALYGAGAQSGGRDHSVTRPRLRVVGPTVSTRRRGQREVCSASRPSWLRPRKWCTGSTWSRVLLRHWEVARMHERPPADLRSAEASKENSTMTAPGRLPRHVLAEDNLTAASPDLLRVPCQVLRVEVPLSCATGRRLFSFPPVHGWPWPTV